jgi:uncharacterized membrane protein HdeD (DUF308 family)
VFAYCAGASSLLHPIVIIAFADGHPSPSRVPTPFLALISPWTASVAILRLLGWFLIISGVLQAVGLIGAREVPYFWLELISAVLAIVIGLLLLRHTDAGLLFFSVLLIVYFMIEGIVKTIFALTIRPFPNWGWVLASGLIGILLSVYLWANLSTVTEWMLGFLLGVLPRRRRCRAHLLGLAHSPRDLKGADT